jgi:hypothetical protein
MSCKGRAAYVTLAMFSITSIIYAILISATNFSLDHNCWALRLYTT